MSKIELVRAEMIKAMKSGDKERKEALSMLLSALKNKAIDKRADLTEDEENEIVMKEIKQTKETLETSPADRTEIIEQCKLRIAVYQEFAPKEMSEDEIKAVKRLVVRCQEAKMQRGKVFIRKLYIKRRSSCFGRYGFLT